MCLGPFKLSNLVNSLFNFKSVSYWQLINFRLTTTTLPSTIKNPTETTRASALRDNPANSHLVLWTWYSPLQSGYRMFQKMDKNVCLQDFIQVSVRSSLFSNLLSFKCKLVGLFLYIIVLYRHADSFKYQIYDNLTMPFYQKFNFLHIKLNIDWHFCPTIRFVDAHKKLTLKFGIILW